MPTIYTETIFTKKERYKWSQMVYLSVYKIAPRELIISGVHNLDNCDVPKQDLHGELDSGSRARDSCYGAERSLQEMPSHFLLNSIFYVLNVCEALIICCFILVKGRLISVSPIQDGYVFSDNSLDLFVKLIF